MARFVIDAGVALAILAGDAHVVPGHHLVAPNLLRSQVLDALHQAVVRGELEAGEARERLERFNRMPIRLLGDGSMRQQAWAVADRLGWASTFNAEYIALTRLQADAFITLDAGLAEVAAVEVRVAAIEELARAD
jgi:predicted nucleic acid-binding protein